MGRKRRRSGEGDVEMMRKMRGWRGGVRWSFERLQVVELLLEAGTKLLETDNDGRVAMVIAAMRGHVDVVAVLLNRGECCGRGLFVVIVE